MTISSSQTHGKSYGDLLGVPFEFFTSTPVTVHMGVHPAQGGRDFASGWTLPKYINFYIFGIYSLVSSCVVERK